MQLTRFEGNPILLPHPQNNGEDLAVFNPGAWYDEQAGEVLLLYRAAESAFISGLFSVDPCTVTDVVNFAVGKTSIRKGT